MKDLGNSVLAIGRFEKGFYYYRMQDLNYATKLVIVDVGLVTFEPLA